MTFTVRDEEPPDDIVVVVRGGIATADSLRRTAEVSMSLHGFYGVSVFLAIGMTVEGLVRRTPELGPERYRELRTSTVGALRSAGFQLVATGAWPHFDVVLADLGDGTIEVFGSCFGPPSRTPASGENGVLITWDLWIDYQAKQPGGLTPTLARFAHPGVVIEVGRYVVVGADDAEPAVAEIVEVRDDGVVLVRVLPGPASGHLELVAASRQISS